MTRYQVVNDDGELEVKSVPELLDEDPELTFDDVLSRIYEGQEAQDRSVFLHSGGSSFQSSAR